jgi:chromate reductase, NAD(P)H dehydrogenase (quinone)
VTTFTVGYFVGSLAKESINRKLALALTRLAPHELQLREIPIGELPLYSYDYDKEYPPAGRALKDAIASVDAVLFVTPEYNRSIPGALKNAIDWASRPWEPTPLHASRRRSSVRHPARSAPRSLSSIFAASSPFATRH